jgi:hypothetical protein
MKFFAPRSCTSVIAASSPARKRSHAESLNASLSIRKPAIALLAWPKFISAKRVHGYAASNIRRYS